MSKLKKLLASLLAVAMLASMGTTVMAEDAELAKLNMYLAAEYTVEENGFVVEKQLYLNEPAKTRGFADIRYGTVVHNIKANISDSTWTVQIVASASFYSQVGTDHIAVGNGTYGTNAKGSHWTIGVPNNGETYENDVKDFWSPTPYAKYNVRYYYGNGLNVYSNAYIKCDSNGYITDNSSGVGLRLANNQVAVDDVIISF